MTNITKIASIFGDLSGDLVRLRDEVADAALVWRAAYTAERCSVSNLRFAEERLEKAASKFSQALMSDAYVKSRTET